MAWARYGNSIILLVKEVHLALLIIVSFKWERGETSAKIP